MIKASDNSVIALKNKRSDNPKYLTDLIASLHTCSENYKKLANESELSELREIAGKLASERAEFALILKEGFRDKSKRRYNTLYKIKPLWFKLIKGVAHSKDDQTIVSIILKNELNTTKKYNTYLYNHIPTIDQLNILLEQQRSVNEAIELFKTSHNLHTQEISMLTTELA